MHDHTDAELLHSFAGGGGEDAFAELVRRYGSLVYGAALRRTGDHSLAEEAAQNVFTTLARRARDLARHPALAAWLHKAAAFEALRAAEKETNRCRLMQDYIREQSPAESGDGQWQSVLPHLDDAVAALPEADRQIILLRFWQEMPFRKISEMLGGSVAACEKRAERALQKISRTLRRRGVAVSALFLAAGLSPALTKACPAPALLARLTSSAISTTSAPAAGYLTAFLIMKSKLTPLAVLAVMIALSGTGGWVAGRSAGRMNAGAGSPGAALPAGTVKPHDGPAAKSHRDALRALVQAARRDLVTATFDPSARALAAARIDSIAPEDIRAALAFADELIQASGDSSLLSALVLGRWAEFDGPAACRAALARKQGPFADLPALAEPMKVWASRDPQAAFTWYRSMAAAQEISQGENERWKPVSSLRWIMGAWSLRDMDGAVRAFSSLTDPSEIQGAMVGFQEMSGQAPGRTALLDACLARSGNQDSVWNEFRSILGQWNAHQPAELAAWLDRCGVPGSSHDSLAAPILTGWLREDAVAAVEWWFSAPGGYPERGHRMETLISAWTEADAFAAAEWLAAQPLDATAAGSMRLLAGKVAAGDPERGFAWAMSIPDEIHRQDALRQVVAAWGTQDPAAAAAAVNAADLDETRKAGLLHEIKLP